MVFKKLKCKDCGELFTPPFEHVRRCNHCETVYRRTVLPIGDKIDLEIKERKIRAMWEEKYGFTKKFVLNCDYCGKLFETNRDNQKYCNEACRVQDKYGYGKQEETK